MKDSAPKSEFKLSKDASRRRLEIAFDHGGANGIAYILRQADHFEISNEGRKYIADVLIAFDAQNKALRAQKSKVRIPPWPTNLNTDQSRKKADRDHRYRLFLVALEIAELRQRGKTIEEACSLVLNRTDAQIKEAENSRKRLKEDGASEKEIVRHVQSIYLSKAALQKNGQPFKSWKSLENTLRPLGLLNIDHMLEK